VPVAHASNPSYSRGRDQKDHVLKPAQANISQDCIRKKHPTKKKKKAQGVGPEFKPQHCRQKIFVTSVSSGKRE
jgi:hypothetical protein